MTDEMARALEKRGIVWGKLNVQRRREARQALRQNPHLLLGHTISKGLQEVLVPDTYGRTYRTHIQGAP